MGNISSTKSAPSLEYFYGRAIGKHFTGVKGGDETENSDYKMEDLPDEGSVYGGYVALEKYAESIYSQTKEKLIRDIAKDVSSVLKISTNYAETAPIQDVIQKFKSVLPDPKSKRFLKNDSSVHKEICSKLAHAINNRYKMEIIKTDVDPATICQKVSEIIYSLLTGVHTEFLAASADISRTLSNLHILKEFVDSANRRLMEELARCKGEMTTPEDKLIKELYDKLSSEIDRQQSILANLTNSVINPTGKSIVELLEDTGDFAALSEDLKKSLGTPLFGQKLGTVLYGTSNVATAAAVVDDALKKIGMTVKEYKSAKTPKDLKNAVYQIIVKYKPHTAELAKMLSALEVLYSYDTRHDDIIKYLESKKGGFTNADLQPSFADMALDNVIKDEDTPFKGRYQAARTSLSEQIRKRQVLRKQLFDVFNSQVKSHYVKIQHAISNLAKKIGNEVEITPTFDLFMRQLANFAAAQPDRENIHIALTGYRIDTASKFVQYQFLESLDAISEVCAELVKERTKGYEYYKQIQDSIDALLKLVHEFKHTFSETLSDDEPHGLYLRKTVGGGDDCGCGGSAELVKKEEFVDEDSLADTKEDDSEVSSEEEVVELDMEKTGGADMSRLAQILAEVAKLLADVDFYHYKTMKRTISEIEYFYRISGVKRALAKASMDHEVFTKNYENILGEEAGFLIDKIQDKYNKLIQALDPNAVAPIGQTPVDYADLYSGGYAGRDDVVYSTPLHRDFAAFDNEEDRKKYVDGYKFLLEYIRESKIEMIEAAQALDLYLSKFTKNIQFKPDEIKEFLQLLEQIQIAAKWFTDKSGNNFAEVFEAFTTVVVTNKSDNFFDTNLQNTAALTDLNTQNVRNDLSKSNSDFMNGHNHYYDAIHDNNQQRDKVGKFYMPRLMSRDQAVNFVKQIERAIKSVTVLDNVATTFFNVNTDADRDIKTFMSPKQMVRALMKYFVASVISIGYVPLEGSAPTAGAPAPGKTVKQPTRQNNQELQPLELQLRSLHRKIAVSLRFNKKLVPWDRDANTTKQTYVYYNDPLRVDDKKDTDQSIDEQIFEACIKSITSKIFTVVGSYSLFNRPMQAVKDKMGLPTNPLRQILGGNEKDEMAHGGVITSVDIYPEATELYVRLPLLVEWYRKVFELRSDSPDDANGFVADRQSNPFFSLVPDMDSIWGLLVKVIFIDAANIENGAYPVDHAQKIFMSINRIYLYYKQNKKIVNSRDIISDFVAHINKQYGLVMRAEIKKYLDSLTENLSVDEQYPGENRVDYDLLGENDSLGRGVAPSDRFVSLQKYQAKRSMELSEFNKSVRRFRLSIENNLVLTTADNPDGINSTDLRHDGISMDGMVRLIEEKVRTAKTDEERFRVIYNELHGSENFAYVDKHKIMLFHEMVVTPLTVLYFLYLLLNDFNKFLISMSYLPAAGVTAQQIWDESAKKFKGSNNPFKPAQYQENEAIYSSNVIARYINNNPDYIHSVLMEELIRRLMKVGCDMNNLTSVYFASALPETTVPVFEYNKLQEVCNELLLSTKSAFHQLRPYLPHSLISRIEDPKINNVVNVSSLFYIEQNLFERLFHNKYGNGLVDANINLGKLWMGLKRSIDYESLYKKILLWDMNGQNNRITPGHRTIELTQERQAQLLLAAQQQQNAQRQVGIEAPLPVSIAEAPFEFPFSYIPFFKSGATWSNPKTKEEKDFVNYIGSGGVLLVGPNMPLLRPDANRYRYRIGSDNLYNYDNMQDDKSNNFGLLVKLNNIIYKYVKTFIDPSTKKIYKPLLEKFAFGYNSKDILDDKNINDLEDNLQLPEVDQTIFKSLALGIKGLLTTQSERVAGTYLLFVEDSFMNVSEYVKELMRAQLPLFEKELEMIVKEAAFLRDSLEQTDVNVANFDNNGQVVQANNTQNKSKLTAYIDNIVTSARSLVQCIDEVQKELNDVPLYFETYKDSIVDYNARNMRVPFMPLSNLTFLMNFSNLIDARENAVNINGVYKLPLIPPASSSIGSAEFKFNYGTRGILSYKQKPSIDFAPGMLDLVKDYNSKMGGASNFSTPTAAAITQGVVMLSRWITDAMYHKEVLGSQEWNKQKSLLMDAQRLLDVTIKNLSCQTSKFNVPEDYHTWGSAIKIIHLTESDSYRQNTQRFITTIFNGRVNTLYGADRSKYRIYNILDLSIVPINVHAMQREIPFANIFNYAYTFDQFMKDFIGVALKNERDNFITASDDKNDVHPEDTMIRYMIDPSGFRSMNAYTNRVYRIMAGDTSLSLNKPKFLSDQFWNKVLLNSLYYSNLDPLNALPNTIANRDLNESRRLANVLPNQYRARNRFIWDTQGAQPILPLQMPINMHEPLERGINSGNYQNYARIAYGLTYIDKNGAINNIIAARNIPANIDTVNRLSYEGYLRYNSKFVSYAEWFVQIQRVIRLFMRKQLSFVSDPVVRSNDAIAEEVTEFKGNNVFTIEDFE